MAFRVDASTQMGSGHVMRCLTLADALKKMGGVKIRFLARHMPDSLAGLIDCHGFEFIRLPTAEGLQNLDDLAHSGWLGVSQVIDAKHTIMALSDDRWGLLVVDHYGLDQTWETELDGYAKNMLVIDDLADRFHHCDILLDQTLGRKSWEYQALVTSSCKILCGSEFALLRSEFAELRTVSLSRRGNGNINRILISMGGSDLHNATLSVLKILNETRVFSDEVLVTVVMGSMAPSLPAVSDYLKKAHFLFELVIDSENMAELMASSDIAIGAAGATSWERCCLGLPSVIVTLADNQRLIASKLNEAGAVITLDFFAEDFSANLQTAMTRIQDTSFLCSLSHRSAQLCDGHGTFRVIEALEIG